MKEQRESPPIRTIVVVGGKHHGTLRQEDLPAPAGYVRTNLRDGFEFPPVFLVFDLFGSPRALREYRKAKRLAASTLQAWT